MGHHFVDVSGNRAHNEPNMDEHGKKVEIGPKVVERLHR